MPSELQSETSRINGTKSKGPRTPSGKRNSGRARTVHGLLSNTILIEGENASRFTRLMNNIREEIQPSTPMEESKSKPSQRKPSAARLLPWPSQPQWNKWNKHLLATVVTIACEFAGT